MMRQQKRWVCHACHREWAFAFAWSGERCPICQSTDIERVVFFGLFDSQTPAAVSIDNDILDTPPDADTSLTNASQPPIVLTRTSSDDLGHFSRPVRSDDTRRAIRIPVPDEFAELIEECQLLITLLKDPHAGLFSWQEMVQRTRHRIWEYESSERRQRREQSA
jgi:hypothetical protein